MDQHTCRWTRRHGDRVACARLTTISLRTLFALFALTAAAHAQSLPTGWNAADIGNPALAGTAGHSGGVFTVEGAGYDIWRARDEFRFVYRAVSGDVDIIARVTGIENTNAWAKAGVMVRASLDANAAHVMMILSPGNGFSMQGRPAAGQGSINYTQGGAGAPLWVKLERRGTAVTAFRSTDGTAWTMAGSQTLSLPGTFYVGLAVSSHNTGALATATFDNVSVQSAGGSAPSVSLTGPANGATFTAPATIDLTATASDTDDGVAHVEFFAGTTLIGTDSTSPYTATWNDVPAGSYSLTAVARDAGGLTTTSAARSITVTPAQSNDTTPPTVSITAPANGAVVQGTVAVSANASDNVGVASVTFRVDGAAIGSPDTTSPYSVNWNAGAASPGTYVLTAEAVDEAGNRTTSANVAVTVQAPPAGSWTGTDVGNPSLAGTLSQNGGAFTVEGAGYDIWRARDEFFFVHRAVTGDVDIVARVASLENTNAWAKAGVMMRATLDANSSHAMMVVSPSSGFSMQSRPSAGGGSVNLGGGSGAAPLWVKLERRGTAITAFRSTDGSNWTLTGSQTLTLPATFYVGLAVTSHNTGALATATFDNVTVQAAGAGSNNPPTVSLTAPANGATFTAPATVSLSANASDGDGGVSQVEFFAGTTLIGTDTTSPYTATWANVPAGTYSLTAVARDTGGLTTTSAARTITVSAPQGDTTPPAVSITAPANGATVQGAVSITANATDNVGVASVTFSVNGAVVGSPDTSSPYSVNWNAATPGMYVLTAEAADAAGNRTTSASVTVTVPTASRAVFVPSSNHDTAVTRYQLDIFTAGADPSTAPPVQTQDLGRPQVVNGECSVDIAATIQSLPGGSYIATVTAIGPGGTARSAPSGTFSR